ncbi:MAG: hypothetical protein F4142_10075 [Nitrospira sp. SB0675_bin_23]|nr:hypothetical protein [Nitrospira sp. SB0675_bin_23]
MLIPIHSIDREIKKISGQNHYRASFSVQITEENKSILCRGRTGKFVPSLFADGGTWREIAKGRIIEADATTSLAFGEIYTGGRKKDLEKALSELTLEDLLEVDQYGAAAKVLSGLAEHSLVKRLTDGGYMVQRMPEDMARHLGSYPNYDFEVSKGDQSRRVEVKSLWGTNTRFARLIHSTTSRPKGDPSRWTEEQHRCYYPTSSCKFATQDIFAVSLFLRTGNIRDFAFARSVPSDIQPHGLPRASNYPEHVNQNPLCAVGDGAWFNTIDEVWDLA